MTPVKQQNRHDPENGVWGDCFRACVASLLDVELERVPHVLDKGVEWELAKPKMLRFLARRRLTFVAIPFESGHGLEAVLNVMASANPGVFYMITGQSRNGCNHVCIGCNGEIVHDPSIDHSGIVGPCDDGFFWIEFLARK